MNDTRTAHVSAEGDKLMVRVFDPEGNVQLQATLESRDAGHEGAGSKWMARLIYWATGRLGHLYQGKMLYVRPDSIIGSCGIARVWRTDGWFNWLSQAAVVELARGDDERPPLRFMGPNGFYNHPCYKHEDDKLIRRMKIMG